MPPFNTHLDKMFAWLFDAVLISLPAIAMPFVLFHPAGSPSVVMIAHGFPDNAIGNVIVDNPFVLKNKPHCLKADDDCPESPNSSSICVDSYCRFIIHISSIVDVNNRSIYPYHCPEISKRNWQCNLVLRAGSRVIYPLSKEGDFMENSITLLFGKENERENLMACWLGVKDAIDALVEISESYGMQFSDELIKGLYDELENHVNQIKKHDNQKYLVK